MTVIYGAGIAGLLAGAAFQTARIFEAGAEGATNHKAVLRFRSPAVGDAVGIPFKKVRVHKGIWLDNKFVQPDIRLSNLYSLKVVGSLADRSIWNVEAADRFIAPEDLIEQLIERCAGRIEWNRPITADEIYEASREHTQAISTLPMSVMLGMVAQIDASAVAVEPPVFSHAPIHVRRWRIPGANVFQTVYFPDPATSLYRASITGDMLIAEYMNDEEEMSYGQFQAFGIDSGDVRTIERANQKFGKIAPIDDDWRKRFIFDLSSNHNIFSLGRFGTWRNLLLDDVIKDISVLKRLMNTSAYDRRRHDAK